MKEQFIDSNFRSSSLQLLKQCNDIAEEYMTDGLTLTLRQLYYQLVSKNIVPNTDKSYKRIGGLVSKARLAGLMDWSAIEDRTRQPKKASEWDSISDLMDSALYSFRLPRMQGQNTYVELWVEKDALAGVLEPIARENHIVLMVNRGYSSQSAMYESYKRIESKMDEYDCVRACILYLGDLDPSGEDMVRDIQDRMDQFGVEVTVKKVALTIDQVFQYDLPPNPAKLTDSRAKEFILKYGTDSWEVDALSPRELKMLVEIDLTRLLDQEGIDAIIYREHDIKDKLTKFIESGDLEL